MLKTVAVAATLLLPQQALAKHSIDELILCGYTAEYAGERPHKFIYSAMEKLIKLNPDKEGEDFIRYLAREVNEIRANTIARMISTYGMDVSSNHIQQAAKEDYKRMFNAYCR